MFLIYFSFENKFNTITGDSQYRSLIQCEYEYCTKAAKYWNTARGKFECGDCFCSVFNFAQVFNIKYSEKDEGVQFFCDEHGCFQRLFCEDCRKPLCFYCNEWEYSHKKHVIQKTIQCQKTRESKMQQYVNKIKQMVETLEVRKEETDSFTLKSMTEIEASLEKLSDDIKNMLEQTIDKCKEQCLTSFRSAMETLCEENATALDDCKSMLQSGKKVLSSQKIELFCKKNWDNFRKMIENFGHFYLLNANDFSVDINSVTGGKKYMDEIKKGIKELFGEIKIKRNGNCSYNVTPGIKECCVAMSV